jgi:hypothetical protein
MIDEVVEILRLGELVGVDWRLTLFTAAGRLLHLGFGLHRFLIGFVPDHLELPSRYFFFGGFGFLTPGLAGQGGSDQFSAVLDQGEVGAEFEKLVHAHPN